VAAGEIVHPRGDGKRCRVSGGVHAKSGFFGWMRVLADRVTVHIGDVIVTDGAGRVALALASGVSVRLDHSTRVKLERSDLLSGHAGALYVDFYGPTRW
jgi:hypothetical protein